MAGNARIRITAENRTKAAVTQARKDFDKLSNSLKLNNIALASIPALMGAVVASQTQMIATTAKLAKQVNISTESLTALTYAFTRDGTISSENFTDAMEELQIKMGEAAITGKGMLVDALKEFGITIKDIRTLEPDEIIFKLSDAIQNLGDRTKGIHLLDEIFGGEGAKFITTMDRGSEAIKKLGDEGRKLGVVYSDEEAKKVVEFKKSFDKVADSLVGLGNDITIFVAGPGKALLDWVGELLEDSKGMAKTFGKSVGFMFSGVDIGTETGSYDQLLQMASDQREWVNLLDRALNNLRKSGRATNEQIRDTEAKLAAATDTLDRYYSTLRSMRETGATSVTKAGEGPLINVGSGQPQEKMKLPIFDLENVDELKDWLSLVGEGRKEIANQEQSEIQKRYNAELAMAQAAYEERKIIQDQEREDNKQRAAEWAAVWESATNSFSQGIGDAFATAIVDQESLGKGLQSVMRSVTKEVISSLIKIGVQQAIQAALGKGQLAASTAAGIGSAAALTAAYGPAALAANIATLGGAALAAAASAPTAAAAHIAAMKGAGVLGQAHDGLDYVPQTGTYLLEKGERVVKKEDNKSMMSGGMGNSYNFTIQAMDTQTGVDFLMKNENAIVSMIQDKYDSRGEKGGPMR